MSDAVVLPPERHHPRRPATFIPPLLIVPFLIFNVLAFTAFAGSTEGWSRGVFTVPMVSGYQWVLTWGDLMVIIGLVFLFLEILKSTQTGRTSVLEHMLSTLGFVLYLVEFLLVGVAADSVFFILMVMSLIDVIAGFTVSITAAGRDVTMMH